METVPARLNFVVVGVKDIAAMRAFYEGWGWRSRPSEGPFARFKLDGASLVLFPADHVAGAVGRPLCECGGFSGTTPAMVVESDAAVEAIVDATRSSGGGLVSELTDRPWGSRTAYVADPEGTVWELAVMPSGGPSS